MYYQKLGLSRAGFFGYPCGPQCTWGPGASEKWEQPSMLCQFLALFLHILSCRSLWATKKKSAHASCGLLKKFRPQAKCGLARPHPALSVTTYMRMYSKSNEGEYVIIFPGYESYYICNTIWKVGLLYIMVNYGWISWKEEMFVVHSGPKF